MLPIAAPPHFRIIAHRGASAYAPENTRPAFELAKEMGTKEIEIDVQLSTDGVPVLCHDTTLQRYGHGSEPVESLSADQLLGLDMGSWFSPHFFAGVPLLSLDQLLDHFAQDFVYHIELKGSAPGLAAAVHALVRRHDLLEDSIFTSFSFEQLDRLQQIAPDCRRGWLVSDFDDQTLAQAQSLELFQLCPRADRTTPQLVQRGRQVASEIRAWGLSGTAQTVRDLIAQVIDSGGDGLTINWPDWLRHQ